MSDKWRVGRSLGRTLYIRTGGDDFKADTLVGLMDTRELGAAVVAAMNGSEDLRAKVEALPRTSAFADSSGIRASLVWLDDVLAIIDGSSE